MVVSHSIWQADVRLSELGPRGVVWPARYLEWMQEAVVCASTAGGYPPDRYTEIGAAWFIREIHLVVHRPLRLSESVQIETWVSDLRRFRSRRQYRITVGDELVARGEADWLYLARDPNTGKVRPRHPDDEMKAAFPIVPDRLLTPDEVPSWPAAGAGQALAEMQRVVRPTEIDRHDHVNHVHYLSWLEDHACTALEAPGTLAFVRLFYDADARPGDLLTLQMSDLGGEAGFFHQIRRGEDLVMRAITRRRTP